MALLQIPLDQITEAHLTQLIAVGASESRYIDYKQATYGGRDADHAECRADITSFANTAGGDIVIGMAESKSVPTKLVPFTGDVGAEKLRLESMARTGVEPPLVGIGVAAVPLTGGGHALIVRTPRSYLKPHRVIYGGKNRFWARSSAGKYEPNVEELRTLFGAGGDFADRVRAYRADRIARILTAPPIPIPMTEPLFVIHVIPLSAFDPLRTLDMMKLEGMWMDFPPPGRNAPSDRTVGYDGLLCSAPFNPSYGVHHAYAQVSRTGIVEGVTNLHSSQGHIQASDVDKNTVLCAHAYMKTLNALGVEPPFAVQVSILRAAGMQFLSGIHGVMAQFTPLAINHDPMDFTEAMIDARPHTLNECAKALSKPLLQQLWNSAGFLAPQISYPNK